MKKNGCVVVDGDLLAYRCAAATEKRSVIAKHKDTLEEVEFDTATLFKEWAGEDVDKYELRATQTPEPISHTYRGMKLMLESILEKTECSSYHIVVSGESDTNFRRHLPLPTRYKDSRKDVAKPLNLDACKQWLVERHNAEVAVGEADDLIVAYKYQGYRDKKYVVSASIDKDDMHGPGWTFNWNTMDKPELIEGLGELYIDESNTVKGKGRLFLYFQMLFGDPADCYKPCEIAKVKFGEKSAYKLLKDCTTDKDAVQVLVNQYKKWYPEPVYYTAWDGSRQKKNWLEIMQMYADCAFMRRFEGDRLDVKKLIDKLGVVHE